MEKFKFVYNNLILTSLCRERRSYDSRIAEIAICKRNKPEWTLAYWAVTNIDIRLEFAGSRVFDETINSKTFWMMAKLGQEILDAQLQDGKILLP